MCASDGFKWTQVLERSTSNDCVVIDLKGSMDADIRCMEMMGLNRFKRSILTLCVTSDGFNAILYFTT